MLAFRKVPNKACEKPTVPQSHLPNGKLHWERGAIFSLSHDKPAYTNDTSFSGSKVSGQVAIVLVFIGSGHKDAEFWPTASVEVWSNKRSAVALNDCMMP
jgi:hypothetical protein